MGDHTDNPLVAQLQRSFREAAFLARADQDLVALLYPEAQAYGKAVVLDAHVDFLRSLVRLAAEHVPGTVKALTEEFPDVRSLLTTSATPAKQAP